LRFNQSIFLYLGTFVTSNRQHQSQGARIDNQSGVIRHEGADYYNIQVQIGSETFATALIPAAVEVGARKIRNALEESLKSGKRTIIVPGSAQRNTWWVGLLSVVLSLTLG
jgi:hypothetical protein